MANVNRVFLIGNLVRDPELRYTPQGAAVCQFALAINNAYTSKDGKRHEDVTYVDIAAWNRQAETCAEYLKKGRPVCVEGRLKQERWEDKVTGQQRSRLTVVAERVQLLGARDSEAASDASASVVEESPI